LNGIVLFKVAKHKYNIKVMLPWQGFRGKPVFNESSSWKGISCV